MKTAVFSSREYDRRFLSGAKNAAGAGHDLVFFEIRLDSDSAQLAKGQQAVCAFINHRLDRSVHERPAANGIKLFALRSGGFNHVYFQAARELGITGARFPAYSPASLAEHTVALILSLNRKIHKDYSRIGKGNFALEGLVGFDMAGKTVGIVRTGKIGFAVARILLGFGCRAEDLPALLASADILTLHCPLTPGTFHPIDAAAIDRMKAGAILTNTSCGAEVDARSLIACLKSGKLGSVGLDVHEEEGDLFFENLPDKMIQDDVYARLLTFPNVLITGHQAFFTHEAMTAIAETIIGNIATFETTGRVEHEVSVEKLA